MDDIEQLARMLDFPLPDKVHHIRPDLPGPAFFPAGTGVLLDGAPVRTLPWRGVMCLGHNFSNCADYEVIRDRGREILTVKTWGKLLSFLEECGIEVDECFFTNALMGVMETKSSLDVVEGHGSEPFRQSCREVFFKALSLQQPRLVLALGKATVRFLGEAFPDYLMGWEQMVEAAKFDLVDRQIPGGPVRLGLPLPNSQETFNVVALTHPSYRLMKNNAAKRRFGGRIGLDCERAMVAMAEGKAAEANRILAAMPLVA